MAEHTPTAPAEPATETLPAEWDALDHAIFDAKVRRGLPWRQVAEEVGMASFSSCRARFYRRMRAVTPAEIAEMRAEENLKLDEREHRARLIFAAAMHGTLLRWQGELVYEVDAAGQRRPVLERDLGSAVAALRAEDQVARARYKLNGLEAPIRVQVEDMSGPDAEIEAAIAAYNMGRADADAEHRTTG